ncbi:MAG: LysM peptidoglycan-binding domain-containing protein [Verrucomicrobia bacterium]|nr:LysM peptidoglycan-binding domain-containing protein [Verrucomicrobiota bacterium]
MNTPSPLIPQGSLQQHQSQGKSTIRIAVFTIIALHAFIFTGLLMQSGCRPDAEKTASKTSGTLSATNNEVPKLDSGYYTSDRELPSVATNLPARTNLFVPTDLAQSTSAPPPLTPTVPPPISETSAQAKEYTIVKGDTLGNLAKTHGVTVAAINKANAGLEPTRLRIGQKILIPAPAASASGASGALGFSEPGASEGASNVYVVKAGDNLHKIAQQNHTTVKAIRAANNMKTDRLLVGKKLKLPAPQKAGGASVSGAHTSSLSTNILTASPTSAPLSNPRP